MISDRLLNTLDVLADELRRAQWRARNDYAIFGSAAMAVRGLLPRDPGDIDLMVARRTWAALMARGWLVETPAAGDPPLLTLRTPIPVHAFFAWNDRHVHMSPAQVRAEAEEVVITDGRRWRCAPLETLLRHKVEALAWEGTKRAVEPGKFDRHRADIEILKAAIARDV
jgi:hypothetical protein